MAANSKPENVRARKALTQERLKELLHYDPETGVFTWAIGRPGAAKGAVAGCATKRGRWRIKIDRVEYFGHQVAFLYMTGEIPAELIDHRDLVPLNNKWENLREATPSLNNANTPKILKRGHAASALKGVYRGKTPGTWASRVTYRGKRYFLGGSYLTEEGAHAAYVAKAQELFGEFARAA